MTAKKILVADDQESIRRGLRQMLDDAGDLYIGGEAADGAEALKKVRQEPWDLVILDVTMPNGNGLDVLREIRGEYPSLPVLMLSVHPASQYSARAMRLGASGYIVKDHAPEELLPKIREVLAVRG
ncbi:MAG: response regulator transcription factor [Candidatus Hydrogenedentes bacterium]|nr:response regulator transcription factor [Candidatus Hydrogenedentota bacterium]